MSVVAKRGPRGTNDPEKRFWARLDKQANGCWLWTHTLDEDGYGVLCVKKKPRRAHRFGYELLIGPIPEGMTIDHLCRVRSCVNPAHMEPVTNGENVLRGMSFSAVNKRKTHCIRGHAFDEANTYYHPRGQRVCRKCANVSYRNYRERRKASRA